MQSVRDYWWTEEIKEQMGAKNLNIMNPINWSKDKTERYNTKELIAKRNEEKCIPFGDTMG